MKAEYRAQMCVDALKDLTTEQIEELKVWLKSESTTLMFDYVAKNRLLEDEISQYKTALAEQAVNSSKIIEGLEAELKSLREFNEIIIRERDWQLEVVVPDLENQLKTAKAEAWDEDEQSFKKYQEWLEDWDCESMIQEPEQPTNPYK